MAFLARREKRNHQWLVAVLLVIVVLLPAATVLWLAGAAVRNERAAIHAKLVKSYQRQLDLAARQIEAHWNAIDQQVSSIRETATPSEVFSKCIQLKLADGALVFDQEGRLVYPTSVEASSESVLDSNSPNVVAWQAAHRLEFVDGNVEAAIDTYAALARVEPEPSVEAQAWLAHARCLVKNDQTDAAIAVLTQQLNQTRLQTALASDGRSLWLDAQLRAAQLMRKTPQGNSAVHHALNEQRRVIRNSLEDYGNRLPSPQRQFGMREFMHLFPDATPFLTLSAERLAARRLETHLASANSAPSSWQIKHSHNSARLDQSSVILLFQDGELDKKLESILEPWQPEDARIHFRNDTESHQSAGVVATASSAAMPDGELVLSLTNPDLFDETSRQQTAMYTLAGMITIGIVAILALAIAIFVRQQLRLADIKNDLTSVVTHELRTPLASIRVLVDTLLEQDAHRLEKDQNAGLQSMDAKNADDQSNGVQRTEYLRLIAQENERLSRLIENFLTFSRTRRNEQTYQLRPIQPAEIAARAVTASEGRLRESGCEFSTHFADDLPSIHADADSMVMCLLNLIDNAVKFTVAGKQIRFRIQADSNDVVFEVADEGVGMTAAESKRAFERFYQADTRLSRRHGGCGLGLSLVRSIVHAHGGRVDVDSKPGHGSTFRIRMPAVKPQESQLESVTT